MDMIYKTFCTVGAIYVTMPAILGFNDLECLNEGASGSMGAGLASFARAGFPVIRGFIVAPVVFSDFLRKEEIVAALELHDSGAEDPADSWRNVKAVFRRARMAWEHEMDILTAFKELDATVSIVTSTKFGASASPVYAGNGQDLLDGIKHCWLKWLRGNFDKQERQDMPAVLVREILDSEVSMELRRKGQAIIARAVFGLPEGLHDPSVSGDVFEFKQDGELARMELRRQEFQYIMRECPARVDVDPEFGGEEKANGEMLASLEPLKLFMEDNRGIDRCGVCFISSRPVICSALLISQPEGIMEMPPREFSLSLMEQGRPAQTQPASLGPVIATRLFLNIREPGELDMLAGEYADGLLVSGNIDAGEIGKIAAEAKRKFRVGQTTIEMKNWDQGEIAGIMREIMGLGMEAGILIPGIRSADELGKVMTSINQALEGLAPRPKIWLRLMYPSNLFFIDELSGRADILALDLDMLGRLMLGGGEDGHWLIFSHAALEKALGEALLSARGHEKGSASSSADTIAVLSDDLTAMPGLLEFLIRNGTGILCVRPGDIQTIRHIVASVEKRMLLERGEVPASQEEY